MQNFSNISALFGLVVKPHYKMRLQPTPPSLINNSVHLGIQSTCPHVIGPLPPKYCQLDQISQRDHNARPRLVLRLSYRSFTVSHRKVLTVVNARVEQCKSVKQVSPLKLVCPNNINITFFATVYLFQPVLRIIPLKKIQILLQIAKQLLNLICEKGYPTKWKIILTLLLMDLHHCYPLR